MALTPKIDKIRVFIETLDFYLFFISETWLEDNVGDNHFILPGYNLERLDHEIGFHGGVCLYYNSGYKTTRLYYVECQNLEVMWVHVRPARLPRGFPCLVTAAIYHPPSSDDSEILEYLSTSLTWVYFPGCGIILAGDFNRLDIKNICINFGLKQIVTVPTRRENTLDLVLTNLHPFYQTDPLPPIHLSVFPITL